MNKSKLNSLTQISAIAGGRYNTLIIENTRSKLLHLLSQKFVGSDYNGASKDIERIVLIDTKKEGYETMLSLVNDIKENNSNAENSLIILNEISDYDHSKTIKKNLRSFKFSKKENVQIPHSIKVLFDKDGVNIEDIQKHEYKIKDYCHLTDEFFIKAVQSNPKFMNYGSQPPQSTQLPLPQNPQFPPPPNIPLQPQPQFPPPPNIPLDGNIPNPYQNLPPNSSCQVIYPPAQTPMNPPIGGRTYSFPQYYPAPPYQPPDAPPGGAYY